MTNQWCEMLGVFDLETTGVDVETARIVSATVAVLDGTGTCVQRWDWLADPGIEIPAQASAVHGITTERARAEGTPAAQVVAEVVGALSGLFDRGLAVTIYNAPYDLTVLDREAVRYGLEPLSLPAPIIDPLVMDKALDRYRKGKRTLTAAAAHYGVALTDAHDAGADAVAAGRVAQAIAHLYGDQLGADVEALHQLQIGWCLEQAASFQEYMRRVKDPEFVTSGVWPLRSVLKPAVLQPAAL